LFYDSARFSTTKKLSTSNENSEKNIMLIISKTNIDKIDKIKKKSIKILLRIWHVGNVNRIADKIFIDNFKWIKTR
jgi:hypothetical protein